MEANGMGQVGFLFMHRVGLLAVSLALVVFVLELVRRGYLKERYALLWLGVSAAGLVVGLFPDLIARISLALDFQYLTVVYVASFLFLMAIVLFFSIVISRLTERNRDLAQEIALLARRMEELESGDGRG